ncbi:MAG TPA: class D sortase [Thermoanaerobaculia bacterium]|nr:class D sortase [Thermoanaerobaculia bacterium]
MALAGLLAYVALDRSAYEWHQTKALRELARTATPPPLAAPPAIETAASRPLPPPPESGALIGRLEIPSAGISVFVGAGTAARTLRRGAGLIEGTTLPGEPGNVGLAGHRDTFFRGLRDVRPADRIYLVTPGGTFEYVVESLRTVAPERSDVLRSSAHPTLTLVTCYPFDFIGPAPLRFIVRAREVGQPGGAMPALADPDRAPTSERTAAR